MIMLGEPQEFCLFNLKKDFQGGKNEKYWITNKCGSLKKEERQNWYKVSVKDLNKYMVAQKD